MKDELIDANQINDKENNEYLDHQYQQITNKLYKGIEEIEQPLISQERWNELTGVDEEFERMQEIRADVEADERRAYEEEMGN